jgi:lysophospholipase L1-like esterase
MLWPPLLSCLLAGCGSDSAQSRSDEGMSPGDSGFVPGGSSNEGGAPSAGQTGSSAGAGGADSLSTGGAGRGGSGNSGGRMNRAGSSNAAGTANGGTGNAAGTANGTGNAAGTTSAGATNAGGSANGGAAGSTAAGAVRVVGRTDGDPKSPRFEWSSVSIQAHFKGTSVQADIDAGNNNYFEIIVDGQTKPRVTGSSGRKKVPIVSGLADGEHDLVIWRRTEANNSAPTQFFGLDLGGGTLMTVTPPAHKLEIIGDSITCGYGNEGAGPNCSFSYDTENSYLAYGSVAARTLGADLFTECWSGKGMYQNYGGDKTETMPTLFKRTIPTDGSSTWNFSWTPDAVIINLGTNDFSQGDPGQPYLNAYEGFVSDLRTHYPNAYVFLVIGPMLGDPNLTTARGYLDQVVMARSAAGDKRVKQILVDPQDQNKNGIGCDYHPSIATDDAMGKAIAGAIKTTLGW